MKVTTKRKKKQHKQPGTIVDYLNGLRSYPQLNHPELVELFQNFEAGGFKAEVARRKLVECNLRLVVSIAKQYKNHNIPIEDLIQEGNLGLMKAVERYKWDKGFRFSTYATWWIKQAIGQHILKTKRVIRLPAHAALVQRKLIQATEEYAEMMGCEPTQEELVDLIGASNNVVKATIQGSKSIVSIHQPASSDPEGASWEDKIEDHGPHSDPFENIANKQMLNIVKKVMENLSPKEIAVIKLRFGLLDDESDHEKYPITAAEVAKIKSGNGFK